MSGPAYIAFEGAEGCGKSTQAALLADALGAVLTRETGGTPVGARLREILHDTTVTDLDDRAEALITAADRAQHIVHVVRPALAAGRLVVSDRSVYSTLAYQGYGRGLDLDELRRINDWAIGGLWPERVILLDAPHGRARRPDQRPRPRPLRAGRRRLPRPRRRRLPRDGRRRPRPLDGRRRRRRRRHGGQAGARRRTTSGVDVTSVWDDVVGQPTAIAQLHGRRGGAGARLPLRRPVRVDQAPGRPGLRRPARSPASTTPTSATPAWR